MMIAAADKMVEDIEKQKEVFQEEMDKELNKLRAEKQVIAREKITQMKLKGELLKRENAITKDRTSLNADREKLDGDILAHEKKVKADKDAFEVYRAKEEKKLADDIENHSVSMSKVSLDSKPTAAAAASGSGSGAFASLLKKNANTGNIDAAPAQASPLVGPQGLSEALTDTLSATHLVAKLALNRKKKTAAKKAKAKVDADVDTRVKEEVEKRLAQALAMTQVDQIEVGVQTMATSTTMESPSRMDTARSQQSGDGVAAQAGSLDSVSEIGGGGGGGGGGGEGGGVGRDAASDFGLSTPSVSPLPPQTEQGNGAHFDPEEMLRQQKYLEMHMVGRGTGGGPLHPPPTLPRGFHLVYCEDSVLELCPGVTYASYGQLESWELEQVPPHILYARRGPGEAFSRGIRRLPRYVPCPRIKACEAIILPDEGLEVAPGVKLIINATLNVVNMELPVDVHVAAVDIDAGLPPGMTRVDLHPAFNVAPTTFTAPKGLALVQCNFNVMLPLGLTYPRGVSWRHSLLMRLLCPKSLTDTSQTPRQNYRTLWCLL